MSNADATTRTINVTLNIHPLIRKMLELGMNPDDAPRFREFGLTVAGDMVRHDGKTLGAGDEYEWQIAGLERDTQPPGDVFFIECTDPETPLWVEIWLARLVPKDCTVYAELRWRPGTGVTIGIHGPIETFRDDEKRARAALDHMIRRATGRPSRDAARAKNIARWHDEDGLTHKQIAARLGWSLSSDEHGTPRRSARVADHIKYGRELLRTEKSSQ